MTGPRWGWGWGEPLHFLVMFWIGGCEAPLNVSAPPPDRDAAGYKGGEDGRGKLGPP